MNRMSTLTDPVWCLQNPEKAADRIDTLATDVIMLLDALDDLLETCELNGMHDDGTYKFCKATHEMFVSPNVGLGNERINDGI